MIMTIWGDSLELPHIAFNGILWHFVKFKLTKKLTP